MHFEQFHFLGKRGYIFFFSLAKESRTSSTFGAMLCVYGVWCLKCARASVTTWCVIRNYYSTKIMCQAYRTQITHLCTTSILISLCTPKQFYIGWQVYANTVLGWIGYLENTHYRAVIHSLILTIPLPCTSQQCFLKCCLGSESPPCCPDIAHHDRLWCYLGAVVFVFHPKRAC